MLRRALVMLRRALVMLRRAPPLQAIDLQKEKRLFLPSTFFLPSFYHRRAVDKSASAQLE